MYYQGYSDAFDLAEEIYTDRANTWIPVTERLPEVARYEAREFLVTLPNHPVVTLSYGYGVFSDHGHAWFYPDSEYGDIIRDDVIAWMEIPEPYEENV